MITEKALKIIDLIKAYTVKDIKKVCRKMAKISFRPRLNIFFTKIENMALLE